MVVVSGSHPLNVHANRRALLTTLVLWFAIALLTIPSAIHAQEYIELTPELDARAADLYAGIMCPICNGQSISQSHAAIAQTMRQMVRERLAAGDTDKEIYEFMTDAFGRDILASPPTSGIGLAVWIVPPIALILGGFAVTLFVRRLRASAKPGSATQTSDAEYGTDDELDPYLRLVDVEMEDRT